MEQRIEVIQEGNGLAIEKELTNREKYLAKMGKRERLIRKQIKSLKKHMQNAKFFVMSLILRMNEFVRTRDWMLNVRGLQSRYYERNSPKTESKACR